MPACGYSHTPPCGHAGETACGMMCSGSHVSSCFHVDMRAYLQALTPACPYADMRVCHHVVPVRLPLVGVARGRGGGWVGASRQGRGCLMATKGPPTDDAGGK